MPLKKFGVFDLWHFLCRNKSTTAFAWKKHAHLLKYQRYLLMTRIIIIDTCYLFISGYNESLYTETLSRCFRKCFTSGLTCTQPTGTWIVVRFYLFLITVDSIWFHALPWKTWVALSISGSLRCLMNLGDLCMTGKPLTHRNTAINPHRRVESGLTQDWSLSYGNMWRHSISQP